MRVHWPSVAGIAFLLWLLYATVHGNLTIADETGVNTCTSSLYCPSTNP